MPPKVQYLISLSLEKGEERLHTNRVESVSVLVFKDEIVILKQNLNVITFQSFAHPSYTY